MTRRRRPHRKLSEAEKRRRQEQRDERDRRPNWGLRPMTFFFPDAAKANEARTNFVIGPKEPTP